MDLNNHIEHLTAHYEALARNPGWTEYVRARAAELARLDPMYAVLVEKFGPPVSPPKSSSALRGNGRSNREYQR